MTDISTADLERQAEAARARVADTAESLRNKMTPGQMMDEFTGMLSGGDAGTALRNLKGQVRDNPLPLALVGAGLAWLMFGQGHTASNGSTRHNGVRDYRSWEEDELLPEGFADGSAPVYGSRGSSTGRYDNGDDESLMDKLSGAVDSAKSMAGEAVDSVKDTVSGAKQKAGHAGEAARRGFLHRSASVGNAGAQMRNATQDLIEREPLVLAALGLAAGAAIGAMLPRTAIEDEHLGGYGKKLRHAGEDMLEKGMEEARDVAAEVYDATKKEADRQGLTPDGDASLVDKVTNVVKAAAAKTEESVRDKTDGNG